VRLAEVASKDFFISYTGADQAWAEWIAETLELAGHRTVLQAWDFRPGENFIERMNEALAEAERVLAVLSPAYFRSEYARDEWTAALVRARGQADRLLPVRIAPCELPPLLTNRIYIDLVDLPEPVAAERLVAGVQSGRARPAAKRPFPGAGRPAAAAARFPGRQPAIFNVPPRNPNFTGRGELLLALRRQLAEGTTGAVVQAEAVYGLGGVGKSQLAVEYAHRYASDYELVWWLPAEQPATISGRLAVLARRLGLPELPSLEEQVGALFDELGQRNRWLLIYDNATEPSDLDGLRPPGGGGHLLITSRNPAWRGVAASVGIDVLPHSQAVAFLRQRGGLYEPAAAALAEALGDLPLALEQAAAYLEATSTPPAEYLSLLRDRVGELFALGAASHSEQTIATTWTLSIHRATHESAAARQLLTLCSFLAPDNIPRSLLTDHPDVLPEPLATALRDRLAYQQALGALRRYSLAAVTDQAVSMHRLVQTVCRLALSTDEQRKWATVALRLVLAGFPEHTEDADQWPTAVQLLAHALTVIDDPAPYVTDPEATVSLLGRVGEYLWGRAEYRQAKELCARALSTAEAHLGAEHVLTAQSLHQLAHVLHAQGDFDNARTLFERALAISEAQLGSDHPNTAHNLSNLGELLADRGDLDDARTLLQRALAIYEANVNPEPSAVANILTNLARVLADQGDVSRALPLHQRALALRETLHGPDHPLTAWSLTNVGEMLQRQGDLEGARTLHERALAIYETRVGADHPYTAINLTNLGTLLRRQGALEAARTVYERALSIRETRLGPDHALTVGSRQALAAVIAELKDQQ
jgi:tetratricopeptide (TPR) repeat protein